MLILSRKVGERIVIAGNIVVTVLEVQGKRVRLGIDAPAGISIRREELPPLDQAAKGSRQPALTGAAQGR